MEKQISCWGAIFGLFLQALHYTIFSCFRQISWYQRRYPPSNHLFHFTLHTNNKRWIIISYTENKWTHNIVFQIFKLQKTRSIGLKCLFAYLKLAFKIKLNSRKGIQINFQRCFQALDHKNFYCKNTSFEKRK